MKKKYLFLCLVFLTFCTSCSVIEEILSDDEDDNCISFCDSSKPNEGTVNIEVTINELNPEVSIELYRGDIEDEKLLQVIKMTEDKIKLDLPNEKYSARVKYKALVGDEMVTVYSLDGDFLEAHSYTECGDTCYKEGDIFLNVTLVSVEDV